MQEPGDHTEGSDQHANTHCNDYIYHLFFPPRTPLRTCLNCYLCRMPLCFANQCISWTTDMLPYFWVFTIPAIRSSIHILKLSIFTFPTFWYHFFASQLLHSLQRILLLHKVPFIIDSLGQVGWTYTISSPALPVLCLQVLYFGISILSISPSYANLNCPVVSSFMRSFLQIGFRVATQSSGRLLFTKAAGIGGHTAFPHLLTCSLLGYVLPV